MVLPQLLLLLRTFIWRKFARATNALCRQRWQYGYVTVYISIAIVTHSHSTLYCSLNFMLSVNFCVGLDHFGFMLPKLVLLGLVFARVMPCCLYLSQVGVLSKWLNESSWFWHGIFFPSILHCVKRKFWYLHSLKIKVLYSGTLSQTLVLENFASACRSSKHVIDLDQQDGSPSVS